MHFCMGHTSSKDFPVSLQVDRQQLFVPPSLSRARQMQDFRFLFRPLALQLWGQTAFGAHDCWKNTRKNSRNSTSDCAIFSKGGINKSPSRIRIRPVTHNTKLQAPRIRRNPAKKTTTTKSLTINYPTAKIFPIFFTSRDFCSDYTLKVHQIEYCCCCIQSTCFSWKIHVFEK